MTKQEAIEKVQHMPIGGEEHEDYVALAKELCQMKTVAGLITAAVRAILLFNNVERPLCAVFAGLFIAGQKYERVRMLEEIASVGKEFE